MSGYRPYWRTVSDVRLSEDWDDLPPDTNNPTREEDWNEVEQPTREEDWDDVGDYPASTPSTT